MRKIHLHGDLAKYGEVFELSVETAGEAVVALCANFPEIQRDFRNNSWLLFCGDPETGLCLTEEAVAGMRLGKHDLHIMPEIEGSKNGGLKAILGVALIAVSFGSAAFLGTAISSTLMGGATWGNAIGQLGLVMALSGVSTMLAPETETDGSDDAKSFTLTGPVSQFGQGQAIQIVYGEVITGGMMISGGVDADGLDSLIEEPVPETDVDPFDGIDRQGDPNWQAVEDGTWENQS